MSAAARRPASYLNLGWPVEKHDGHVELITGTVVDALEVPGAAGILAASWWRHTDGYPDEIRGLPMLPDPRQALAVIAAGDSHFFLVRAGECPWRVQDQVTTATAASGTAVIRWHSGGSRIPAPPWPTAGDSSTPAAAVWAHLPDRAIRLPSPAVLLHLLATATATTKLGPHMLTLDDGVLAIPMLGQPSAATADHPEVLPAVAFGFGRGRR